MKNVFYVALAASLLSSPAIAQIHLSSEVKDAVSKAVDKNVDLKNGRLEISRQELERKSVMAKYIPKVEANAVYAHFNADVTMDAPESNLPIAGLEMLTGGASLNNRGNVFLGGVSAKTVLFSGGQIANGAKALEQKNAGTALMLETQKDDVAKDLIISFDNLQLLREAEVLIDDTDRRLAKESERVERAIAAGLAIPYDRDKIRLATLELDAKRNDVKHKQHLLALKISQATGLDTVSILTMAHAVEPILITERLDASQRKEVQALESFRRASEFAVKKEKGTYLPAVGAFGGYSYTNLFDANASMPIAALNTTANLRLNSLKLSPTWFAGVGVKWEIFGGFERKHKVEEAELGLAQVENKLQDAREKVNLQLENNQLEYQHSLDQIKIATQQVAVAQNNNILAEKQYKSGLISISELLEAENDLYKAMLNKIEKVIAQRKSAIDVYQASGQLMTVIQSN